LSSAFETFHRSCFEDLGMYALRVTCAVLHNFGLLTADLRRHVRPFARPRMAAIYLLLANSALMIQRVDSTNQEDRRQAYANRFS
jgi:hypothetical protein